MILDSNLQLPTADSFFNDFGDTKKFVNRLVTSVKKLDYKDCLNRAGCYVTFYDRRTGRLFSRYYGPDPLEGEDKKAKYLQCSTEQVTKMVINHLGTSFTRFVEEDNEQLRGGVSFNDSLFIGCAGYQPEINEALSFIIGLWSINRIYKMKISLNQMEETKNQFVPAIYDLMMVK